MTSSSASAISACITAGSSPSTICGRPAVAAEELLQLVARDTREDRRVRDLVAVQMQNRQHGAVLRRLRNLFECQAVASGPVSASPSPMTHAAMSSGVVEHRAERVAQRVAQLAAFVNASGRFGRDVARNAAWKRELAEQRCSPASSCVTDGYTSLYVPSR